MAERQAYYRFSQVAQKWRDLAERRRDHFAELYDSGRWRHYYSEDEFIEETRKAVELAETWAEIAPRCADPPVADDPCDAIALRLEAAG